MRAIAHRLGTAMVAFTCTLAVASPGGAAGNGGSTRNGSGHTHAIAAQTRTAVDIDVAEKHQRALPMPYTPSPLPPTQAERRYHLPPTHRIRLELIPPELRHTLREGRKTDAACSDMNVLAGYQGDDLAGYVAGLPEADCLTPLFTVAPSLAKSLFSRANLEAVAQRFASVAVSYRSEGTALANLSVFFRAAYSMANEGRIDPIGEDISAWLRPAMVALVAGVNLFAPNDAAPTTAGTVAMLITDMHDEASYLELMKQWVVRLTNTPEHPDAARALDDPNVGYGFTGILTIFYFSHTRADAVPRLENDPSFATALYGFVEGNEASLLPDARASYQLEQAANEAFRFAQHPALLPAVRSMIVDALDHSTMSGPARYIWLSAAQAVKAYDEADCSFYKTCNFEQPLAQAILSKSYSCAGGVVRLRTQSLTPKQAQASCAATIQETSYFHTMLGTRETPVADDNDTTLEAVVFSDRDEYHHYSPVFFDNDVDNGGVYLEGEPSSPTNQSRFIAFIATWLQPHFEVWNLKHEFVHYLDGRYDMYGDFEAATQQPAVWWIEGLAEYISRGNDDTESIDAAKTARYSLHEIFANTYDMDDYVNRAYRWGYMATRFMFERHPENLAAILPMFRTGQYQAYWAAMQQLPRGLDDEFAQWVATATTAGTPQPPWHAH